MTMLKRKSTLANTAQFRLQKLGAKRARLAKTQRARFLTQLRETTATDDAQQESLELVKRLHDAKSAEFLHRYRIAA